jgi:hypothetical protein
VTCNIGGSQDDWKQPNKSSSLDLPKVFPAWLPRKDLKHDIDQDRLSAAMAQLWYKTTMNELQQCQVTLQSMNQELTTVLENVHSENLILRNFLENEHKTTMKQQAFVQQELDRHIQEKQPAIQKANHELHRRGSPLDQLATIACHIPYG